MRKGLFILLCFSHLLLCGQDLPRVRKYIDTLSSTHLHGRGYVNKGDSLAAVYLQDRFKEIGLLSFHNTNSVNPYWQNFNLSINTFPGILSLCVDGRKLEPGKDYILNPASRGGKKKLKVIYLDSSTLSDPVKNKKFLSAKTSKYAVVIKPELSGRIEKLSDHFKNKIYTAGAVIELNDKKLTASLSTRQILIPWFVVSKNSFPANTKMICFETEAKFISNYQSQNVIGYIKGKTQPDSFLMVSAHYDHLGRMGKEIYFPGANDNASGISMLLEMAYYFQSNPPDYSIVFIAFGAEEAGLIGSEFYTRNPYFPLSKIKFLLNLDLLGTGDDGIMVVNGSLFNHQFNLLEKINKEKNLLPAVKKRGAAANSDHYHFTQKGVSAFFIYTLGGIAAYHDIYDKPETLPLTRFQEVFNLLVTFLEKL